MGRGLRLACESCDFTEELVERAPYIVTGDGGPQPAPEARRARPDGYWSDWLCGECRLPQREVVPAGAPPGTEPGAEGDGVENAAPRCARCGGALLPFDVALSELAEASHSRVWLDLAAEREARDVVARADAALPELQAAWERGDATTQMTLDELAALLSPEPGAHDLTATTALAGLARDVENAPDVYRVGDHLANRLVLSERHIRTLENWCDEEALLPGVPCPKCSIGQLVHWPVWD